MRVAVEGCGHGALNEIYASVEKSALVKGWDTVDLLIIGGDFQVGINSLYYLLLHFFWFSFSSCMANCLSDMFSLRLPFPSFSTN